MATITCSRCGATAEPMAECDLGGKLGETILAHTCPACWKQWEQQRVMVINEYRLNLGNPAHFDTLLRAMKEFLRLPE